MSEEKKVVKKKVIKKKAVKKVEKKERIFLGFHPVSGEKVYKD